MTLDPLAEEESFGKALPVAGEHWDLPPSYLLTAVHVIAALVLLGGIALSVLRWRDGDDYDTDNMHALLVVGPTGLAMIGAFTFTVPGMVVAVLLLVVTAAVWYAVLRPLAPYEDDDDDFEDEDDWEERRPSRRPAPDQHNDVQVAGRRMPPTRPPRWCRSSPPAARASATSSPSTARASGTSTTRRAWGRDPHPGRPVRRSRHRHLHGRRVRHARFRPARRRRPRRELPEDRAVRHARRRSGSRRPDDRRVQHPPRRVRPAGPSHGARQADSLRPMPAEQAFGAPPGPAYGLPAERLGGDASTRPSPSIYGLLTVFTLIDGTGEGFDRLAEDTVEAVRQNEPDTLIYTCHSVKSAPLQRIIYEIYRDEVAYAEHQRQPHAERFVAERQNMVLATNVIELNVNAAKVLPLPTAFRL
nr:hypothetical protein GCM10020093_081900 [Planobispora longispora]